MDRYKRTLLPRAVLLMGVLAMGASVFLDLGETMTALLQFGGGLTALAGLVWLLLSFRQIAREREGS